MQKFICVFFTLFLLQNSCKTNKKKKILAESSLKEQARLCEKDLLSNLKKERKQIKAPPLAQTKDLLSEGFIISKKNAASTYPVYSLHPPETETKAQYYKWRLCSENKCYPGKKTWHRQINHLFLPPLAHFQGEKLRLEIKSCVDQRSAANEPCGKVYTWNFNDFWGKTRLSKEQKEQNNQVFVQLLANYQKIALETEKIWQLSCQIKDNKELEASSLNDSSLEETATSICHMGLAGFSTAFTHSYALVRKKTQQNKQTAPSKERVNFSELSKIPASCQELQKLKDKKSSTKFALAEDEKKDELGALAASSLLSGLLLWFWAEYYVKPYGYKWGSVRLSLNWAGSLAASMAAEEVTDSWFARWIASDIGGYAGESLGDALHKKALSPGNKPENKKEAERKLQELEYEGERTKRGLYPKRAGQILGAGGAVLGLYVFINRLSQTNEDSKMQLASSDDFSKYDLQLKKLGVKLSQLLQEKEKLEEKLSLLLR